VPNGALVGARAADSLRDIDGHRYRDDGKCCEQQNSYTAADVAQETGCRVWRWRSVSLWQESDVVKVDLRLESSVPLPRAMRRLPAGGLGVRHRWPRSLLGGFGHHGRLERSMLPMLMVVCLFAFCGWASGLGAICRSR
jgi:hypothetical protein